MTRQFAIVTRLFRISTNWPGRSVVRVLVNDAQEGIVSGDKQLKKDGNRKEKKTKARKRDFEQPIVGAASSQRVQDASSLSGDDMADRQETGKAPGRE